MPLVAGNRLGTYEIIGPIGAGGMGEVYRAKDLRLGRQVAIKVLPTEVASDTELVARFERERLWTSAIVYHALGHGAESDLALDELIEKYAEGSAYQVAEACGERGEVDRAFE